MIRLPSIPWRAALAATLFLAPGEGRAQVTVADEGSFTITVNGQRAGREDFWIRSTPDPRGAMFVATATVVIEGRRVQPTQQTDKDGNPLGYDLKVTSGVDVQEYHGRIQNGRMAMTVRGPRGESVREILIPEGAVVLDDDVFHQFFFLARGERGGAVPAVVPRRNARVTLRVTAAGTEPVSVGGASIRARHLVVDDGAVTRDVWVDDAGRVLRVAIPSRGLVAQRDDPPRT